MIKSQVFGSMNLKSHAVSNVIKETDTFVSLSFNSVHIPQNLEMTDAKMSLQKMHIKFYFARAAGKNLTSSNT